MYFNIFKFAFALAVTFTMGCALRKVRPEYDYYVEKNKIYKSINGVELAGDLYLPDTKGLRPAAIVVHGGGWNSRIGDMRGVARNLARQGFVVYNVTYRLAPQHLYPAAVEDVTDAVKWLRANANQYRVNTEQLVGWGYSAGSHLIMMVGLDPKNNLKALVGGGTPADLTVWPLSPIVKTFIGATYAEKPNLWQEASPVRKVEKNSPPVFLYHGKKDTLVEIGQMHRLENALKEKGVQVSTLEVKGWGHAGTYVFSQNTDKLATEFLIKQLGL